jgi:hypothetical protein
MHFVFPFLFAALLDDLLKLVVPFVFLIFWVLSQIAEAKKKAKAPPRPAQPPVPPSQQGQAAQGPPAADPLREQVDAFLRRASGQAPAAPMGAGAGPVVQNRPRPATPDRDSIEILLGNEPVAANRQPLSEPLSVSSSSKPTPPSPPKPAPPRPQRTQRSQRVTAPRPKSVAEHVNENVTSAVNQIREEVSRLGERVVAADRQFDTQMQQKFDHEIGSLGDRHAERVQDQQPAVGPVNPAVIIATLLANPDGMRQAMIINEVLRRPEERW